MGNVKLTAGQKFLNELNACECKEDLLRLASMSIRFSPSKRGLEQRVEQGLSLDLTIINMAAAMAHMNAKMGRDFGGTNSKLAMIMAQYAKFSKGSPKHFASDFQAAFPDEYAMRSEKTVNLAQMRVAAVRGR